MSTHWTADFAEDMDVNESGFGSMAMTVNFTLTRQQYRNMYQAMGFRNVPRWPQAALALHRRRRHR